jgi:8-oxo-dGTP diphosphatase
MKTIEVVAAVIMHDGLILCVQRGESKLPYISKKFEFPGGKMELNESKEETIVREIREELKMEIEIIEEFVTVDHQYPDFRIIMHSFICSSQNNSLTLTEHLDFKWLNRGELSQLDWAAADLPIVEKLMNN